jgi:hypothetical protein
MTIARRRCSTGEGTVRQSVMPFHCTCSVEAPRTPMSLTRVSEWCTTKLLGSTCNQYLSTTMIVVYTLSTVTRSATITPNP